MLLRFCCCSNMYILGLGDSHVFRSWNYPEWGCSSYANEHTEIQRSQMRMAQKNACTFPKCVRIFLSGKRWVFCLFCHFTNISGLGNCILERAGLVKLFNEHPVVTKDTIKGAISLLTNIYTWTVYTLCAVWKWAMMILNTCNSSILYGLVKVMPVNIVEHSYISLTAGGDQTQSLKGK